MYIKRRLRPWLFEITTQIYGETLSLKKKRDEPIPFIIRWTDGYFKLLSKNFEYFYQSEIEIFSI